MRFATFPMLFVVLIGVTWRRRHRETIVGNRDVERRLDQTESRKHSLGWQ